MLRLTTLLQMVSCSSDILYTLRGQDALRSFQRYGLTNIYGIKSTLSRKEAVPFPLIHAIGAIVTRNRFSTKDYASTTFFVEQNSTSDMLNNVVEAIPIPIGKAPETFTPLSPTVVTRGFQRSERTGVTVQMVEVRKVKRIGGGYPYGPRNFSVVEFPQPLRVDKYLGDDVAFMTRNATHKGRSMTIQSSAVWAIKRFDLTPTMRDESLSCRYCVTYWKMQTKFKPSNVYVFCCK